ncbi:AAA family ATPase [Streptomyces sp. SID14478]|uniref:AAA family ATPase n=1 Tax=Streptomyces sp. SID14478 TaxID=2706073 RepID=UPI0031BBCCD8
MEGWLRQQAVTLGAQGGSQAFDSVPVQGGPVLYLALEDTPRRLQTRMGKLLGGQQAPAGLTLVTECPPFPQGGSEAIAGWLDRNPDARMVVIDAFAKMRGQSPQGVSAYDADYVAVGYAKRLADHYGIAVVLVHHVRKMASEDFLTEVSGTNGIAGAADATLVLKRARGQADGILHVTGRDVNEAEYALSFQEASGAWHLLDGPATDHTVSDTRAAILRFVRAHPGAKPKDVALALHAVVSIAARCVRRVRD